MIKVVAMSGGNGGDIVVRFMAGYGADGGGMAWSRRTLLAACQGFLVQSWHRCCSKSANERSGASRAMHTGMLMVEMLGRLSVGSHWLDLYHSCMKSPFVTHRSPLHRDGTTMASTVLSLLNRSRTYCTL